MTIQPSRQRILIPREHWTPVLNRVFTEELRQLRQPSTAAVYLCLIDWAYHQASRRVAATYAEIAAGLQMDYRVVQGCIAELCKLGLIDLEREGVRRSHIQRNVWRVSAVDEISGEPYTPIPTIITRQYLRAYPNSVLLALLLYHQHIGWNRDCWVGAPKLSRLTNWSLSRVRTALRTMMFKSGWKKLGTELPQPLSVRTVPRSGNKTGKSQTVRHYSVLAVKYTREKKPSQRSVHISKPFIDFFGIELPDEIRESLSSIFRSRDKASTSLKRRKAASVRT